MKERASHLIPLVAAVAFATLLLWWMRPVPHAPSATVTQPARTSALPATRTSAKSGDLSVVELIQAIMSNGGQADLAAALQASLVKLLTQPGAIANESVLTFKDDAAYRAFLARAAASGLEVVGQMDGLRTARVRFASLDSLTAELLANSGDYTDLSANIVVEPPAPPAPEQRVAGAQASVGTHLLQLLGVTGDNSTWGHGVTIAVLDSGVVNDSTLNGRLRTLDLGLGTTPPEGDGHATAVASIAAGASADAPGVAPGATVLSIRVAEDNGQSNLYTLAEAIIRATDAGAQIINISLGAYSTSNYLSNAIDYATEHGAVIVAAAGNDQAAQLAWPAADPRVVSVGSIDATGQQDVFSNSGPQLKLTAPGYDVQSAWLDGQRVYFTGTSASTPVVSGAIAAMISENPGMTATEAWQAIQQYSSDGGPAGADPAYGAGSVNLGWAMDRNDPARVDTAISSHYFDAANGEMDFVIQNRGGQTVSGLSLALENPGGAQTYIVPPLQPGEVQTVTVPVDEAKLATDGQITYRTELMNPGGIGPDVVPSNNRAASVLSAPKTTNP